MRLIDADKIIDSLGNSDMDFAMMVPTSLMQKLRSTA